MAPEAEFFEWFAANAQRLAAAYRNGELGSLTAEVKTRVDRTFRGMGWEIGPSDEAGDVLFFAVSAGSEGRRLEYTRGLIADAPSVPGWEFLPALPPKRWSRRRVVFQHADGPCTVDFDQWTFSARPTRRGCVVRFLPTGLSGFEERREWLGWRLLEFELGQEFTIVEVSDVVIVDELADGRPIDEMYDALWDLALEEEGD